MARRRLQRKVDNDRPVVTDDFIYNDPLTSDDTGSADAASDTPEEAIRKLRRRPPAPDADSVASDPEESADTPDKDAGSASASGKKVYSSGIMLDDNLQPL